jgi:GntR family transcriptional regulator
MFVRQGAQAKATEQERARFLGEEWPRIRARIDALGLSLSSLVEDAR